MKKFAFSETLNKVNSMKRKSLKLDYAVDVNLSLKAYENHDIIFMQTLSSEKET